MRERKFTRSSDQPTDQSIHASQQWQRHIYEWSVVAKYKRFWLACRHRVFIDFVVFSYNKSHEKLYTNGQDQE